jgi:hypothetical protein
MCLRNSSESYGTSRYITITPHIHKLHLILRSPVSLGFPINVVHMAWLSPLPPIFHVLLISFPRWWRVQIMGILIIYFYPASFNFICVWSICSSQHSLFNHNLFSLLKWKTGLHSYIKHHITFEYSIIFRRADRWEELWKLSWIMLQAVKQLQCKKDIYSNIDLTSQL